jgi:hypothetical protein
MKTIEEVKEFIKKSIEELKTKKCQDAQELEQTVGKVKFGWQILNFILEEEMENILRRKKWEAV